MSTARVQMAVLKGLKKIFAKQCAVLMSMDGIAQKNAVIIVTTTKFVTPSLETVANAMMVIKMQNVMKNAMMALMENNANTNVENVLM